MGNADANLRGAVLSLRNPHNFSEEYVELLAAINLLCRRQRLALADRHVEIRVRDLAGRILQVLHRLLE